ncbi:MAG: sulfite exporter TauE/SafE family protein [Bacteroidales bacterium]|nr:sulfite exporter TauE/SafE family protein [Bacteroidales bacterium]
MDFLQQLVDNSTTPVITAILLGLMTAISPCPLATNITAIAFISKQLENRRRVFLKGLVYTLGRSISYTGLGLAFYFGAGVFELGGFFQHWGERLLGPLLMIVGFLMLDLIPVKWPSFQLMKGNQKEQKSSGYIHVLALGMIFALAFCPYSGVLFFGMLVPMIISSSSGLLLPPVFAISTAIPVIIVAYLIAYTISEIGLFYNRLKVFEFWFRKIVALTFIGVGLYYLVVFFAP